MTTQQMIEASLYETLRRDAQHRRALRGEQYDKYEVEMAKRAADALETAQKRNAYAHAILSCETVLDKDARDQAITVLECSIASLRAIVACADCGYPHGENLPQARGGRCLNCGAFVVPKPNELEG